MEMGEDPIREAAESFGWNSETQIPLTVTASHFPEDLTDAALAQSSIGQYDVTATPMQINMMTMAIANGGTMMQPSLIESVRGSDLQVIEQHEPEEMGQPISSEVADEMTELMIAAVEDGTAYRAQNSSIDIAAKTGTGQIGGTDLVNLWVTGFAPADDPQYAVTVAYERIVFETGTGLTAPNMLTMFEAVIEE